MKTKSIEEILEKYNINGFNNNGGTDKCSVHSYCDVYEEILEPYISTSCTLMEIGVAFGGSMLLWQEFLPNCNILGLDIQDKIHNSILEKLDKNRYEFIVGDAYSNNMVSHIKKKYNNGFDIIIDDGPHDLYSQCLFLRKYVSQIKPDGILIIEDIQDIDNIEILQQEVPLHLKNKIDIRDLRQKKGVKDDILFIINNRI